MFFSLLLIQRQTKQAYNMITVFNKVEYLLIGQGALCG